MSCGKGIVERKLRDYLCEHPTTENEGWKLSRDIAWEIGMGDTHAGHVSLRWFRGRPAPADQAAFISAARLRQGRPPAASARGSLTHPLRAETRLAGGLTGSIEGLSGVVGDRIGRDLMNAVKRLARHRAGRPEIARVVTVWFVAARRSVAGIGLRTGHAIKACQAVRRSLRGATRLIRQRHP